MDQSPLTKIGLHPTANTLIELSREPGCNVEWLLLKAKEDLVLKISFEKHGWCHSQVRPGRTPPRTPAMHIVRGTLPPPCFFKTKWSKTIVEKTKSISLILDQLLGDTTKVSVHAVGL